MSILSLLLKPGTYMATFFRSSVTRRCNYILIHSDKENWWNSWQICCGIWDP